MASPPPDQGRPNRHEEADQPIGPSRHAEPTSRLLRGDVDAGPAGWWWPALCGLAAVAAALLAALGPLDHAAAAVVAGSAVMSARSAPRRAAVLTAVGALAGIFLAALLEQPAALAGVAVAAAAVQLALSPRGRPRLVAAGLVVATVVGALALRASDPSSVGGPVDGSTGIVLVLAAIAVAALALPRHGGAAGPPTAAAACAALSVSALGAQDVGVGVAAVGLAAALGLAFDRRPAAALVAAALTCLTTPAAGAAPLALVAAAVAAALAVPWSDLADTDQDPPVGGPVATRPHPWGLPTPGSDGPEAAEDAAVPGAANDAGEPDPVRATAPLRASVVALAAVPAGAIAVDAAVGRSARAALAVVALAVAVAVPSFLERTVRRRLGPLPLGAWPAAVLAAAALVLPGRLGWVGDPVPHWSAGVGFAALGAALALLPLGRSRPDAPGAAGPSVEGGAAGRSTDAPAEPRRALPASAMGAGAPVPDVKRRRRRKGK